MMKLFLLFFGTLFVFCSFLNAEEIEVYFGPNGGFSPLNQDRTLTLKDGTVVKATLSYSLVNMLERVEDGGQIKISMYSLSDMRVLNTLIDNAKERNITVKLILDACTPHSAEQRKTILKKVREARKIAEEEEKPFNFQIKIVPTRAMEDRGRIRVLNEEKTIYGTMHEKFGILYQKNSKIPFDCFAGSANASTGADQIYAESRMYFYNRPAVARQFQEEFARLWNEYSIAVEGECPSEVYIPAQPMVGDVEVIFNSEALTEEMNYSIDNALKRLIEDMSYRGHLDIAMFSFTHRGLAETILNKAKKSPRAKFRLLLDQTMLVNTSSRIGVIGPWFEREIEKLKLKNIEIRYKWRSNAYGWDKKEKRVDVLHSENPLLHHKLMIVDKNIMANGSYNWSDSAEERNLENVMILNRNYRDHGNVIDRYLAEFDFIWDALKPEGPVEKYIGKNPQSITAEYALKLSAQIIQTLEKENNQNIMALFEKSFFLTFEEIQEETALDADVLQAHLDELFYATLICKETRKEVEGFSRAD